MQNIYNFAKFYTFFIIILIFIVTSFAGCNYASIVNINEQTAIYQNMGFVKYNSTDPQIESMGIKVNTMEQINNYLANNNINILILDYYLLILQENNKLQSVLHFYIFKNNSIAQNFKNTFKNFSIEVSNNICIQNDTRYVETVALSIYYFNNFYQKIKH